MQAFVHRAGRPYGIPRRFHQGIAVVESLVVGLLSLNEVRPVDDGVSPVEDPRLSLPRVGARQ